MRLHEVQQQVEDMPTVMGLDEELNVMTALMSLDDNVLRQETVWLTGVIQDLRLSHRDEAFMELTEENEGPVHAFCDWLRERNEALALGIAPGVIKDLDMSAAQAQHLMAPCRE